jgi:hypothetical protein
MLAKQSPSPELANMNEIQASKLFGQLPEVLQTYMAQRAGEYDIPAHDLLRKIPEGLTDNPLEIFKYLKAKHISHIQATSEGGSSNAFANWTFEDGAINIARNNDPMNISEFLSAQADGTIDSMSIEFGTPDPGFHGYNQQFVEFFGIDELDPTPTFSHIGSAIEQIARGDQIVREAAHQALQESLLEVGVPAGYVTVRGLRSVWPFLSSIDWKRFRSTSKYRNAVISRALMTFRDGGWKEAAKAVVIGFLIAAFPPLSYMMAALGLTGIASVGIRWLATHHQKLPTEIANALNAIAEFLNKVAGFLRKVLVFIEKVVDVVIEIGSSAVKKVVKAGQGFVKAVSRVADSLANGASAIARSISSWVFGWFCKSATA